MLLLILVEIFFTLTLHHRYKDRSQQTALAEPLASISAFKLLNKRFNLFDFDEHIYNTNIPKDLLPELIDIGAGFGNSNNPTNLTQNTNLNT